MDEKIVFVDVDDVCALIHNEWLKRYNRDYNDDLKVERITNWGMNEFVKPECGAKIYKYLSDPDLYDYIPVREGALKGINTLRELGYRVLFATSCVPGMFENKFNWLKKHDFLKDEKDYITVSDKSLLMGDYMIDDCYENVCGFSGYGYLFTRPWNANEKWYHRVRDWNEFISIMTVYSLRGM